MPESRANTAKHFDGESVAGRRAEPRRSPWTSWARSLIDRYGPVKQRHNSLEMTLVYPFAAIRLMRERWMREKWLIAATEFKPQINLLFHPNLLVSQWRPPAGVNKVGDVRHESRERNYSLTLAAGLLQTSVLSAGIVRHANEPGAATGSSPAIDDHHLNLPLSEPHAHGFVTARRHAMDEPSRIHLSSRILENAHALTQRLVTHTRRVEQRIEGLATLKLRQIRAAAERRTASTKSPMDEPAAQVRMAAYEGAAASMQPEFNGRGIDVDQLTDRVIRELDRRVVAVRERLGRI